MQTDKEPLPTTYQMWNMFEHVRRTGRWIYLAPCPRDVTIPQFRDNWRDHSLLAGQFRDSFGRNFRHVRQCVRLTDARSARWMDHEFAGVNLLWLNQRAGDVRDCYPQDAIETMMPDEVRVFGRHVLHDSFAVEDRVLKPGPGGRFGHILFRKDSREVADAPAAAVRQMVHAVRWSSEGYGFSSIVETWFDTLEHMHSALDQSLLPQAASGDLPFLVEVNFEKPNDQTPC